MRAHASRPAVPGARQQQADGSRLTGTPARPPWNKDKTHLIFKKLIPKKHKMAKITFGHFFMHKN